MSKKCTPLWREAHFEVKMYKTHHVRTIFGGSDVEKVHAVVARSTFPSQNVQNTPCTDRFCRFRSRFAFHTTLQYITLHYNYNYNYTSLHSTTLHSTTLHCTQLHSITLNYTTVHYTTLHYTTLHYITLHYITLHFTYTYTYSYTPLHEITLHWCVLCILTLKCASRHNGVHFFDIATSKSGPTLRCFVHFDFEMCFAPPRRAIFSSLIWPDGSAPAALASLLFDPPEPQIIGKTQCFATSHLFAHLHLLSSYSFSSTLLSSNLPLLSASSLLCFSSVHIVGSLTSKLPSISIYCNH